MRSLLIAKTLVFLASLLPTIRLAFAVYTDQLGANPIEKILHKTGFWTLSFLLIALSVTPLRLITGKTWVGQFRRMLGLFAFFYACLHLLIYLGIDQFFDWNSILKDVTKRPYVTVGLTAFLLLIPLAITSTAKMIHRLGAHRWKKLHRSVYLIAILGVVHFSWLVKKDLFEPLLFATGLGLLLMFRIVPAAKRKVAAYRASR